MPTTPSCQSSPATTYPRARRRGLGPGLDLGDRLAQDPVLDQLPLAVQLLEPLGQRLRRLGVGREQQLERDLRLAEPARGVDPRREPERDAALVERRRVDARRRA